jgi:hypothetical protein
VNRLRLGLSQHRHFSAAILGLVLALRALVPAGYMPAFDHGSVGVRICGSQVAQPMPAGMHHGAGHEDKQSHPDQPCAFAGLAAPADPPPVAAALPPAPQRPQVALVGRERGAPTAREIRARPPVRGPPILA